MLNRRDVLLKGLALGCSAAASPLVTPVALAEAPGDNRLIVVILRGGMDGLDAVRPVGDPAFAALRPRLADGRGLPLGNGNWAFNPALEPLLPLWQAGEVGALHAVSTPYRDERSHFDGQDILEAGSLDIGGGASGWLNRFLTTLPGAGAETAYAIGREQMAILTGTAPVTRWSPEAALDLSPQAERLLELVYHDDPLFRDASGQAISLARELALLDEAAEDTESAEMMAQAMSGVRQQAGGHVEIARFAADRLRGNARIASFSLNGWDTHQAQEPALRNALVRLSDTILTLRAELGPIWQQTAVLCMTEFGRTAFENGTRGTDHGTGGAMIYAGGALRGGQVLGSWPGLDEGDLYNRRDLMPTGDVRAAAGWVIRGLFGTDSDVIEQVVFPGLDLGADQKIVV